MKNRIDSSRKKTPWDDCDNLTLSQSFIMHKYKENYNNRHPKLIETNEEELINSIKIKNCPYCNSDIIIKKGFTTNKIQRYYCKKCMKKFTPLTGTIFENHKISLTEWVEFLLDIFNYGSISLTSKVNKNSVNTTSYWIHKIFLVLNANESNAILSGNVYLDEFYYSVIKSDIITKEDGSKPRGISKNKHCVGIAYDGKNIIAKCEGMAKPTIKSTETAFINCIKEGSKLIHDDEKSHKVLINKLKLIDECYKSAELKLLEDKENPLRKINHQCDLLRQFLNAHSGFDRKDLQNYLNLYCFMNSGKHSKLEKVNELLILCLTTKVSLKYRNFYKVSGPLCK